MEIIIIVVVVVGPKGSRRTNGRALSGARVYVLEASCIDPLAGVPGED